MKATITTAIATTLIASPAFAHPGHFAEAHGHDHWLAAGALALAGVIAVGLVIGAVRRSRRENPAKKAGRKA
jgi:hydrogenase/urease accessory protein HupE